MKKKTILEPQSDTVSFAWVIGALAALVVLMFSGLFFSSRPLVISQPGADLWSVYPLLDFGFSNLRGGHVSLWNPHIFSGMPFVGASQTGLLYPVNLIFLILPLHTAINVQAALHIFLSGTFMALWTRHHGLHPVACGLAGAVLMLGGPVWLHLVPGHLGNIGAIAWAPLIFLALDLQAKSFARGTLVGCFGLGMQMLVGQPQYVFYTGIALGLYCLAKGVFIPAERTRPRACVRNIAGLALVCLGAVALASAELLTVLQASAESTRAGGHLAYDFAAMFSFPPENLITFLVPGFFGNMTDMAYWGRCLLWEMSLFMGVSGLAIAACAIAAKSGPKAYTWLCVVMFSLLLVLAFGAHSPHFSFFFDYVPGFNKFRGNSKFSFQAFLFSAFLVGIGSDRLLKERIAPKLIIRIFLGIAAVCLALGVATLVSSSSGMDSWWAKVPAAIAATRECFSVPISSYSAPEFVAKAGSFAGKSLLVAAALSVLVGGLLWALPRWSRASTVLITLAVVEMGVFAYANRPSFDLDLARNAGLQEFLNKHDDGSRVLLFTDFNIGMLNGSSAIWGYDSFKLRRYAEFMAWTQGQNPDAVQDVAINRLHPLFKLLRLRHVFIPSENGLRLAESANPLPQLLLVSDYEVIDGRSNIFERMGRADFDPNSLVILESEPDPRPGKPPGSSGAPGTVRLVDSNSDMMTIEADVSRPAILLVTDPYSKDWRARPLAGSSQSRYEVLPADYILRAIPLGAGQHKLRLEYAPSGFLVGRWISLVAWLGLLGGAAAVIIRARRATAS